MEEKPPAGVTVKKEEKPPAGVSAKKPSPDDYEWGQILGEGAFGDVVLVTEKKSGRQFAVKKMLKIHLSKEANSKFVMNERNVLSRCNHRNIVKLFSAFRDSEFFYYVLNLAENGEVLGQIRKHRGLHINVVRFWTAEIVSALEYLHNTQNVIHRDLKPENLLLDEKWHILLTDFGTSKICENHEQGVLPRKGSFVGTAEYMAPELVKDTQSCFGSDLWSLGCTVYQMLCARPPFRGVTDYLTMKKIQEGVKVIVYPENFPEIAKNFIEQLLHDNPADRIGAGSFSALKEHPFFNGINWNNLAEQEPPAIQGPEKPMIWQDDIIKEEQERLERERNEVRVKWDVFFYPNEKVVEAGLIFKKRKMTRKKRFLILTNTPRLFYIDPKKQEFKGEIPWDYKTLRVDIKNDTVWRINTPKRIYDLEDVKKNSARWKEAIEKCQQEGGRE